MSRRRESIAMVALAALGIAACEEPIAPRPAGLTPTRRTVAAGAADDALLYRPCTFDWSSSSELGVVCDLKVRNADGSSGFVLRATDRLYVNPGRLQSWSPDGTRIAYAAWSDGNDGAAINSEILVVTIGDGGIRNLTNDPAADHSPAWSPDGARIAFLSDRGGGTDLYVMNADGSEVARIASGVGPIRRPAWSPDASRIAFTCTLDAGNMDVCAIGADGTGLVRLTTDPAADLDPDFSPDGARIVFVSTRFGTTTEIAVMDADGANVTRLTTAAGSVENPAWSPSGNQIAFVKLFGGACQDFCDDHVYVMTAEGAGVTLIEKGTGPAWARATFVPLPPDDTPPVASFTASCSALSCTFDGSASTDDRQSLGGFIWSFGDGTSTESDVTPNHVYTAAGTYEVTLTVIDDSDQRGSVTHAVTVVAPLPPPPPPDRAPVARFTASCAGLTCSFESGASSDDRGIVSRAWSFGDGQGAGDAIAPSHRYGAGGGTFDVTLTVTDDAGQTSTVVHAVTAVDQPPVARFTWSCAGTTCTLDGRSSTDDAGVISYAWDLGRLGTATGAVVTAQLRGKSSQVVTLTVRDAAGQTSSATQTLTVK